MGGVGGVEENALLAIIQEIRLSSTSWETRGLRRLFTIRLRLVTLERSCVYDNPPALPLTWRFALIRLGT